MTRPGARVAEITSMDGPATIQDVSVPRADTATVPIEEHQPDNGHLTIDRLADDATPVEVVFVDALSVCDAERVRGPHRHDYHEVIWARSGSGCHSLDGRRVPVSERTVTLIGRGQVHQFARAKEITGAVVRFGDELLHDGAMGRADPSWLLAGCGGRVVHVPEDEVERFEAMIAALATETTRPADERSADLERHLLSVVLLWIERWYDAQRDERGEPEDASVQLYRRFARLLERDFAAHHDAAYYADALAVPPAALSQALTQVTGHSTKELVTDRVMIEAVRLLRYTDRTVGEVAYLTGFSDPLYFSRAFKRHVGVPPSAYRDRIRGATNAA
jgi:AraC family transcriptional activator of pobA